MLDPPLPLPFDVPAQGAKPFQRRGVVHAAVWVGEQYYPNVADDLEEMRRLGMSTRIPDNFPVEQLTPASRLFRAHARAIVLNAGDWPEDVIWTCPTNKHSQRHIGKDSTNTCLGLSWMVVEGGRDVQAQRAATIHLAHMG